MVGDLALSLVGAHVTADDFAADPSRYDIPDSVIGFFRGELGDPPGGWPELRSGLDAFALRFGVPYGALFIPSLAAAGLALATWAAAALMVSLPLLAVTLFVGLAVSVFQAVTQVHEMTLTFVPKVVAVGVIMIG